MVSLEPKMFKYRKLRVIPKQVIYCNSKILSADLQLRIYEIIDNLICYNAIWIIFELSMGLTNCRSNQWMKWHLTSCHHQYAWTNLLDQLSFSNYFKDNNYCKNVMHICRFVRLLISVLLWVNVCACVYERESEREWERVSVSECVCNWEKERKYPILFVSLIAREQKEWIYFANPILDSISIDDV